MRDLIDKNYVYGAIIMWISARKPNTIGVVVEAKADELFFRKSFLKKTSFFKTNGFPVLFEVMNEIEKNNDKGIIGIIDADFRRINNEKISLNNIFMTDGHDIEMMTINSQAWNEVANFHIDRDKLSSFETKKTINFKEYIFKLSKEIACVRYLNNIKKLKLIFRTLDNKKRKPNFIDYHKFINIETLNIDTKKMIQVVENKSFKHNLFKNEPNLKSNLTEICNQEYELTEFCNGHDILNIFALSLKKAIANKNIASSDIENQLIIAYRYEDFKKTQLYKSLKSWETKNYKFNLFID